MAQIDTSPSQVATSALQAIPFGSIIGGPLTACIDAQAQAAQTTWEFIQKVGLQTDKDGKTVATNVKFEYIQGGRQMVLIVPLLTIVPIPYIAIDEIDIQFKAQISASSSSSNEVVDSTAKSASISATVRAGVPLFGAKVKMSGSVSSKKDSKAMQESKYSVEYTMDVHVHAGQDSLPAGMAKVLEILTSSVDTINAKGELKTSESMVSAGDTLVVSYRDPSGLWDPKQIKWGRGDDLQGLTDASEGTGLRLSDNGECALLTINEAGTYHIRAGEDCKAIVLVAPRPS